MSPFSPSRRSSISLILLRLYRSAAKQGPATTQARRVTAQSCERNLRRPHGSGGPQTYGFTRSVAISVNSGKGGRALCLLFRFSKRGKFRLTRFSGPVFRFSFFPGNHSSTRARVRLPWPHRSSDGRQARPGRERLSGPLHFIDPLNPVAGPARRRRISPPATPAPSPRRRPAS
jgi:hypothetical protein